MCNRWSLGNLVEKIKRGKLLSLEPVKKTNLSDESSTKVRAEFYCSFTFNCREFQMQNIDLGVIEFPTTFWASLRSQLLEYESLY